MKPSCSKKRNLHNQGKSTMKFRRLLSLTLLTISVLGLMGTSYAANTDGAVTFTVTTANYTANYSPNNVAVVWVVDSSNRFVKPVPTRPDADQLSASVGGLARQLHECRRGHQFHADVGTPNPCGDVELP